MREIIARNVNDALETGVWHLKTAGALEDSRNGPVLVAPEPVMTTYKNPTERVLFCPRRDANHVFHLMEAIWMIAGGKNVEWLLKFNSTFGNYAEADGTMHGAYGHRWRSHFGGDQLRGIVDTLRRDPGSRQAVLGMWDPRVDLVGNYKDRPCNTTIYFDLRGGRLNMTVCCRSNDMIWGAYGSNVVHFSMLQELLAEELGREVGVYRQFSNNFHAYAELELTQKYLQNPPHSILYDKYGQGVYPFPLINPFDGDSLESFTSDCIGIMEGNTHFHTSFFNCVAYPLMEAYLARKEGLAIKPALDHTAECDWKMGFVEWVTRRRVDSWR